MKGVPIFEFFWLSMRGQKRLNEMGRPGKSRRAADDLRRQAMGRQEKTRIRLLDECITDSLLLRMEGYLRLEPRVDGPGEPTTWCRQ